MAAALAETNIHSNVQDVDQIEVDDASFSDLASSIGSDDSDFCSLTESVRRHVFENGRRYHSKWQGRYVMPNDETEQKRLDLFYEIRKQLLGGKLHVAKLPDQLHNVLDCGTGTGIWAVEFAEEHPETQVFGVDLSPIQPDWIPPNCVFEVDDLEQQWLWKEKFDFIHSGELSQSIRDWKKYIEQIYNQLRPGGVVEFHEIRPGWSTDDDSIPKGGWLQRYEAAFFRACEKVGLKDAAPEIPRLMEEVGFEDVQVIMKKIPIGTWPSDPEMKAIGGWELSNCADAVNSYGLALFTRELGMSTEEAGQLASNAFRECMQKGVHTYSMLMYITGRRPE